MRTQIFRMTSIRARLASGLRPFADARPLVAALCLAGAAFAHNEGFRMFFSVDLTGDQMVPAVTTDAKGAAGFTFNGHGDSLSFHGAAAKLSGPVTGLALYSGLPGAKGTLFHDISLALKGNSFSGNLPVSVGEIGRFMRDSYYLVISTAANPNGEIRGQVKLARNRQYIAELKGNGAVPKTNSTASGLGVFYLAPNDSAVTVKAVFGGLEDSITSVHFGYGKADAADSVGMDLTGFVTGGFLSTRIHLGSGHAAPAKRSAAMHNEFMEALEAGEVYLTVRTKAHAAGEIRGQLEESRERVYVAEMNGAKHVPAVATAANGMSLFLLSADDSTLTVHSSFNGLDSISSVHLHRGSKTTNADTLPNEPQADLTASLTGTYLTKAHKVSSIPNPATFLKELAKGSMYVNVHTKAHAGGAIRGQLGVPYRIGTSALLNGAQEVPAVTTKAFGAVVATMDPDSTNVAYSIVADSLGSQYTLAHFHKQAVGVSGPPVLDLTALFTLNADKVTGLHAAGTWWETQGTQPFTRALAKAFAAESLYVNIHSTGNPSGEIRGQVKDLIPDTRVTRIRAAGYAAASRLLFGADGGSLRIQGQPGKVLRLDVLDMRGRVTHRLRLAIAAGGFSQSADLGSLRPGLYVAAWMDGNNRSRRVARFLRQ